MQIKNPYRNDFLFVKVASAIFGSLNLLQSEWRSFSRPDFALEAAASAVQREARATRAGLTAQRLGIARIISMKHHGGLFLVDRWPRKVLTSNCLRRIGFVSRNP